MTPDFLCLAKCLTAGYLPMAATLTHSCIWDAFPGEACQPAGLLSQPHLRGKPAGRRHPWQEQRSRRACTAARSRGALLRPLGDVVVIMPPLSVGDAELHCLPAAAEAGIRAVSG